MKKYFKIALIMMLTAIVCAGISIAAQNKVLPQLGETPLPEAEHFIHIY